MALVKDVVCNMMVDPETAPAKTEYKGETTYFCAPGCKVAFEKAPEKVLKAEGEDARAGSHHRGAETS